MEAMSITIEKVATRDALYQKFSGQYAPQKCHMELDCQFRTLSATYDSTFDGAVSRRVWNRLAVRFSIPCLTADAANALMEEVANDCAKICDGFEVVWNGHNHVGRFSERAAELVESLGGLEAGRQWDESEVIKFWDACDWFSSGCGGWAGQAKQLGITPTTTDKELDAIVAREEAVASDNGSTLEGTREHLIDVREHAIQNAVLENDEGVTVEPGDYLVGGNGEDADYGEVTGDVGELSVRWLDSGVVEALDADRVRDLEVYTSEAAAKEEFEERAQRNA